MRRRRYNSKKYSLKEILGITLFILFFVFFLYEIFVGRWSLVEIYKLRKEKTKLEKDLAITNSRIVLLETDIHRLNKDTFFTEKIAREKVGMVKKGEKMLIIYNKHKRKPFWKRILGK